MRMVNEGEKEGGMRHVMREVRAFVANKCRCRNYIWKKEWLFLTRIRGLSNFAKENEIQT